MAHTVENPGEKVWHLIANIGQSAKIGTQALEFLTVLFDHNDFVTIRSPAGKIGDGPGGR